MDHVSIDIFVKQYLNGLSTFHFPNGTWESGKENFGNVGCTFLNIPLICFASRLTCLCTPTQNPQWSASGQAVCGDQTHELVPVVRRRWHLFDKAKDKLQK